ncbi:MAG: hypothetical protein OXG37_01775 [Actinomycetia bacterium]|nr:hypothetical protein [Actinomycetes bacterium]
MKGKAEIVTDAELLEPLTVKRTAPTSGLLVTAEEVFPHCGRALIRARAWDPEIQIDRSAYPIYGQVLADQIAGANAKEIDDEDKANRERLLAFPSSHRRRSTPVGERSVVRRARRSHLGVSLPCRHGGSA